MGGGRFEDEVVVVAHIPDIKHKKTPCQRGSHLGCGFCDRSSRASEGAFALTFARMRLGVVRQVPFVISSHMDTQQGRDNYKRRFKIPTGKTVYAVLQVPALPG